MNPRREYLERMRVISFPQLFQMRDDLGIPMAAICAATPIRARITLDHRDPSLFHFDDNGRWAWIVPAVCLDPTQPDAIETGDAFGALAGRCPDEDRAGITDLVAFDERHPGRFARRCGLAPVLGMIETQYWEPAPVLIHRDVLRWLQSGCSGLMLLGDDKHQAGRILRDCRSIKAEDSRHAEELRALVALPDYPPRVEVGRVFALR